MQRPLRNIAICAPATALRREYAERVEALAQAEFPELSLHFHDQCFVREGHFAGDDATRLAALVECANDPAFDAVWFAKGGYGSNRIVGAALERFDAAANRKTFLGYSDCGTLLGGLYRAGLGWPIHAPMPIDIKRDGGEAAIRRVLGWFGGSDAGVEPTLGGTPAVAFNLTTLAMLVGTPFMPTLAGHEVLIEEVGEYHYAIDRLMFHVAPALHDVAGIRLGAMTAIPQNNRPFGSEVEEIVRDWCERSAIAFLGHAAIGHTADNTIVPFGLVEPRRAA